MSVCVHVCAGGCYGCVHESVTARLVEPPVSTHAVVPFFFAAAAWVAPRCVVAVVVGVGCCRVCVGGFALGVSGACHIRFAQGSGGGGGPRCDCVGGNRGWMW